MANKKARVLTHKTIEGIQYKPNQVIDADQALIKSLVKEGIVDDSPAAVKHCIDNEDAKPIIHQSEAAAQRAGKIAALEEELAQLRIAHDAETDAARKQEIIDTAEAKQAELDALLA